MAELVDNSKLLGFDWKRNPNQVAEIQAAMRQKLTLGDIDLANKTMENTMMALKSVSEQLRNTKYDGDYCKTCRRKGPTPESLAKTASYMAKMVDEVYRLCQFADGGPDSRTEVGLGDLLQLLTPDQFQTFQDWIAAGKAKTVNVAPD